MQIPHKRIGVGDRVRVRRRAWSVLAARHYDDCDVVTLRALDASARVRTSRVILPFEPIAAIDTNSAPRVVSVKTWRRRCRALLASEGTPASVRAAHAAHIDLLPHQLEPVLAVLTGRCCRLLIADEVGLGKTIQAALVIAELMARGAADRCLVLTPAQLRDQWIDELSDRFALSATLMDTRQVGRTASQYAIGTNPWATAALVVASIDYVKRAEILPVVAACRWDVIVVDEAHVVGVGSDRQAALDQLCRQAAYVVLVTATPHHGDRRAFLSLCSIGQTTPTEDFCVFRRTREDVAMSVRRRIHRVLVDPTSEERQMYGVLDELMRALAGERDAEPTRWLMLGVLHKRAQSSAYSLEQSIRRRLDAMEPADGSEAPLTEQLRLPLDDPGGELNPADDAPAVGPILADQRVEHRLLNRLLAAARQVQGQETKVIRLHRLLHALVARGETAIVFTEYRDTLLHVQRLLQVPCAILHGGLGRDARRGALSSFSSGTARVLLATDAAGEGLNLQRASRVVINLELPWNPMRLEQRIGRVDRIGQRRAVHAFHLIARATRETSMLDMLAARIARAHADIGAGDPLGLPVADLRGEPAAPPVTLARLREEAAAECARLAGHRRFGGRGENGGSLAPDDGRASVSFIRRRRARRLELSDGEVLALVQAAFVDDGGDVLAAQLTPLSCRVDGSKSELRAFLTSLPEAAHRLFHPAHDPWIEQCLLEHRMFWNVRLQRERAIAARLSVSELQQRGLFDRRADREHDQRLDRDRARQFLAERWIRVAEAALRAERFTIRSIAAVTARR
jgi:superfamily II DNA or RNA helicase